ncbi:MAG: lipoate--protein ligase family protein [Planctomycetota bacterium]
MQRLNFNGHTDLDDNDPSVPLALDEAMLNWADHQLECSATIDDARDHQSIRFWQFDRTTVVLGRSSKIDEETNRAKCERSLIPILRRCTGGATVVGGTGCLMYAVVLRLAGEQALRKVDAAHDYVMDRVLGAIQRQLPEARRQGVCDLTWRDQKFSGNSLRIARHHLLYHGTVLHGADLDQFSRCLRTAPRQPDYRRGRNHRQFIRNVPIDPNQFQDDLARRFGAASTSIDVPEGMRQVADHLMQERYRRSDWHQRH